MRPPFFRPSRTLALGVWLAARGPLAIASFALAALGAFASIVAAFAIAHHGGRGTTRVPTLAAEAIAWSAGVTLAFGAALRAIPRDRDQGILALVRARGADTGTYVRGRVFGLAALLAGTVGVPTLIAGLAATAAGGPQGAVARSSLAALAYAVAFAATLGPVAMASLNVGSRLGGYVTLLCVLVVPELLSPWTSALFPQDWQELTSIPAALDAVRTGFLSPSVAGARGARALAGLAAVIAVSLVVVSLRARAEPELAA
jgi:hypothetical protein